MTEWNGIKVGGLYKRLTTLAGEDSGVHALVVGFEPPEPGPRKRIVRVILLEEGKVRSAKTIGWRADDGTYNFGHALYKEVV